jgi:hypothetical protein
MGLSFTAGVEEYWTASLATASAPDNAAWSNYHNSAKSSPKWIDFVNRFSSRQKMNFFLLKPSILKACGCFSRLLPFSGFLLH